jgi:threonylcarbamoyladenosine tRNA methylthiotransferase MtaB
MGRRYDTARYAAQVARVRAAVPSVAIHGDVIVGFPTEDEASWRRSIDFIRSVDFAGIHVFRYSPRPATPAIRMTGQVDERTKKARAAELLAIAAEARARFAAAHVGREASVLFESRLETDRWVGHAEDHTLVAVSPPRGVPNGDLENVVARVTITGVDQRAADRTVGRLLELSRPARPLRPPLPVLAG